MCVKVLWFESVWYVNRIVRGRLCVLRGVVKRKSGRMWSKRDMGRLWSI